MRQSEPMDHFGFEPADEVYVSAFKIVMQRVERVQLLLDVRERKIRRDLNAASRRDDVLAAASVVRGLG